MLIRKCDLNQTKNLHHNQCTLLKIRLSQLKIIFIRVMFISMKMVARQLKSAIKTTQYQTKALNIQYNTKTNKCCENP